MSNEHQEYIQNKINPVLESLVTQLLLDRPEDPIPFMINWLSDQKRGSPSGRSGGADSQIASLKAEIASLKDYITKLEANKTPDPDKEDDEDSDDTDDSDD
eukprot:Platyproteum_vivax@DN17557_c0_g1_i1.p1